MAMLTRLTSSGTSVATPGSPKALQRFQNCIAFLWPSLQSQQRKCKSNQLDAIDCFTNDLVHSKTKKWEEMRENVMKNKKCDTSASTTSFSQTIGLMSKGVISDFETLRSPQLGLDIRILSQAQLDNLLTSTLEIKNKIDFLYLIRQCIRWKQLPSAEVLLNCLRYLSTLCRLQQIEAFEEICSETGHPLVKVYAGFAAFKAMAMWRSGSSDTAIATLHLGYRDTVDFEEGRRMIRNVFRNIAEETLTKKSEAVLVKLMDVARSIYDEHRDIFIVACVWKQCFASNWFCDQKSAADLFEHYKELQQLVGRRSASLCSSFLNRHNIDAVHRLIEAFLQYKQDAACAECLSLLFNYQYQRKDLRACAEIVKSCSELEMPLSELQNEQFLTLFLSQTESPCENVSKSIPSNLQKPYKQFQYKF
ncbi:uncharacterized protein LOC119685295 [Teleopsis dalmanni]|uniref:uncharacterized protein LOC119685295 n=1 Tax=Teleopsis dalmanni TaxID=139649 RepID=UPI0018CDA677|nr:uncharacterized protein LOC119685295 [Teleopsis dalmanni]